MRIKSLKERLLPALKLPLPRLGLPMVMLQLSILMQPLPRLLAWRLSAGGCVGGRSGVVSLPLPFALVEASGKTRGTVTTSLSGAGSLIGGTAALKACRCISGELSRDGGGDAVILT